MVEIAIWGVSSIFRHASCAPKPPQPQLLGLEKTRIFHDSWLKVMKFVAAKKHVISQPL
jgi:hypothetical protein